jgi:hypothetical protein
MSKSNDFLIDIKYGPVLKDKISANVSFIYILNKYDSIFMMVKQNTLVKIMLF